VRALVVAAIKAAPNQLGNPLAESLGAGPLGDHLCGTMRVWISNELGEMK